MADGTPAGHPVTERDQLTRCTKCRGCSMLSLCWCVAVLAATLVAVLMVAIVVDPAVREVRVVPAGPPYCGAIGWADHSQPTPGPPSTAAATAIVSLSGP